MTVTDAAWAGVEPLAAMPDWLLAAADPQRFGPALQRQLDAAGDGVVVVECRPEHFRLKSGMWTFLCHVTLGGAGVEATQVALEGTLCPPGTPVPEPTEAAAPFASPGWRGVMAELGVEMRIAAPDVALPVLPRLVDPERARPLLEEAIRAGDGGGGSPYADLHIAACHPRVVRYARGSRCTIRYDLEYGPERDGRRWPDMVVAKTYRGDKGRLAFAAMSELWASELARSPDVAIAEPLGYLPDLRVLIQGPVAEDMTLKQFVRSTLRSGTAEAVEQLDRYLAKTARGLAVMHHSGAQFGVTVTLEDEVAEVTELIGRVADVHPELADVAAPLLRRVIDEATRFSPQPVGASHRAFRPAQVLVHQGDVAFIDFDGFCQSEPALDVAMFRAAMRDCGLTDGRGTEPSPPFAPDEGDAVLARLDDLCDSFLRHYQAVAEVSVGRVMLWETLDLLTYVLHAWSKVRPSFLGPRMLGFEHHLRRSGLSP